MSIFETKQFAEVWRKNISQNSSIRTELLNPKLAELIGPIKGKNVLDIGCGEGFSTRTLLNKDAAQVVGIDINPYLISSAREDIQDAIFTVASADNLPMADSSTDLVFMNMVLMNLSDPICSTAISEVSRVLRSGGVAVVSITHPLYNLFANGISDELISTRLTRYCLNEEIRVNTVETFEHFQEYRRPLSWYHQLFTSKGLLVTLFDEISIIEFDGISEKHKKRLGYPIFAVYRLTNNTEKIIEQDICRAICDIGPFKLDLTNKERIYFLVAERIKIRATELEKYLAIKNISISTLVESERLSLVEKYSHREARFAARELGISVARFYQYRSRI